MILIDQELEMHARFVCAAITGMMSESWHPSMGCAPPNYKAEEIAKGAFAVADACMKEWRIREDMRLDALAFEGGLPEALGKALGETQ